MPVHLTMKTDWGRAERLQFNVKKPFWKYNVAPSAPFQIATTNGGVTLRSPAISCEKYEPGTIQLTRSGQDLQTGWSMYRVEGKELPISGYELYGLAVAGAVEEIA